VGSINVINGFRSIDPVVNFNSGNFGQEVPSSSTTENYDPQDHAVWPEIRVLIGEIARRNKRGNVGIIKNPRVSGSGLRIR